MVFHGALETGYTVFAIAAWLGAIFTFASFLKAGHSVFFGKASEERPKVAIKENSAALVVPILVLALLCIFFGVVNKFPLTQFIQPILAGHAEAGEHLDFSSHALDLFNPVAGISIACLLIALALHVFGWKKGGRKPYLASEPIHKAPVLKQIYDLAEKRVFDLYEQGIIFLRGLSMALFKGIDRPIDAFFEKVVTAVGGATSGVLRKAHTGHYANYLAWCLGGLLAIAAVIRVLAK
jgi:NADH:ubiquinone oxidoreductase subunit 5 (subunit L)/multisubunit Na+/H+ antiporter MnhA subunit